MDIRWDTMGIIMSCVPYVKPFLKLEVNYFKSDRNFGEQLSLTME